MTRKVDECHDVVRFFHNLGPRFGLRGCVAVCIQVLMHRFFIFVETYQRYKEENVEEMLPISRIRAMVVALPFPRFWEVQITMLGVW